MMSMMKMMHGDAPPTNCSNVRTIMMIMMMIEMTMIMMMMMKIITKNMTMIIMISARWASHADQGTNHDIFHDVQHDHLYQNDHEMGVPTAHISVQIMIFLMIMIIIIKTMI